MMLWLNQENMSWVDSVKIPGYRRKAFRACYAGKSVKNVSTLCYFVLVMFQNKSNKGDILVELRHVKCCHKRTRGKEDITIDPKWFRSLVKGTEYEEQFVEIEGRSFFKGVVPDYVEADSKFLQVSFPSTLMCKFSNAYSFLLKFGDNLASAIEFKDRITNMDDAAHLTELLDSVDAYIDEQDNNQRTTFNMKSRIEKCVASISELESERRRALEKYMGGVETLHNLGIEFDET